MFLNTVEWKRLNILGADTITREDNANMSRYYLRWGSIVESVIVHASDKPGSPRRNVFELLERKLEMLDFAALDDPTPATFQPIPDVVAAESEPLKESPVLAPEFVWSAELGFLDRLVEAMGRDVSRDLDNLPSDPDERERLFARKAAMIGDRYSTGPSAARMAIWIYAKCGREEALAIREIERGVGESTPRQTAPVATVGQGRELGQDRRGRSRSRERVPVF